MSARKLTQDSLAESQVTRLLELQRALLAVVARRGPLQDRLDQICTLFERAVDGMVSTVMRLDAGSGKLHFISAPSAPHELLDRLDDAYPGDGNGSCAHTAWSRKATYVGDAIHDPHWAHVRDVAQDFDIHSCWSAPIMNRGDELLGTFALTSLHAGLPDAFHRQLLDLGALSISLLFDQDQEDLERGRNDRAIRRLALVADTTPNGILFTDSLGTVEWSNTSVEHLIGRTTESIREKNLRDVLDLRAGDPDLQAVLLAIRHGEPFAGTLELRREHGANWFAQLTSTPRLDEDGRCEGAVVMLVDVSDLRRLTEFNVLIAEVDKAIVRQDDPQHLYQTICDLAVRHAHFRLAWIGAPDPDTGWFKPLASAGPGREYLHEVRISSRRDLPEGRGPCGKTWHDGRSRFDLVFGNDPDLTPWERAAQNHGFAAIATLPLRRAGRICALLSVYHSEMHSFDTSLRQLLETLAFNISNGLDRIDLSQRERDIQALNESMLESSTVGVVLTRDRVIQRANQRAADILGAGQPHELYGISAPSLYLDPEKGLQAARDIQAAFASGHRAILEAAVKRLDGREIWLRMEGAPFDHQGYDEIWSLIDQTEQHHGLQKQLLLADALASVQEGVIITGPDQRIVYANQAFDALTGYDFDEVFGHTCRFLQGPDTDPSAVARIHDDLHNGGGFVGEILNYRKDGSRFWNLLTITPLRDESGNITHFVGVQRDITDLRELNTRLEHLAFHDELTGLPNRRALDRYFAEQLPAVVKSGQHIALGIIDLDDFKAINDTHGHDHGDLLLKTVAERIGPRMGPQDFLARLGGDEFVVVLGGDNDTSEHGLLRARIDAIGQCFAEPFDIGLDAPLDMGLSMGVALCPAHATAGGELLRLADEALFQAKRHKLDRSRWWSIHGETESADMQARIEPYGSQAADILELARRHLTSDLARIVKAFHDALLQDPQVGRLLESLQPTEQAQLRQKHLEHLMFLLRGDISRADMVATGKRIGRMHALIGLDSVLLMRWMAHFHECLGDRCGTLPIAPRHRYRLSQLLDQRLQDDLQAQLEAQGAVQDRYAAVIEHLMPDRGSGWNDAIGFELRLLTRLPGLCCCMVLRPGSVDSLSIESSAGRAARPVTRILRQHYGDGDEAQIMPGEDSLIARSWQGVDIRTIPGIGADAEPGSGSLPADLVNANVHAAACIPVLDEQRMPVALLLLLGNLPNQFESKYMRQFMRNLQLRGNEIWQRSTRPPPPVPHEQAVAYRHRLFHGGLRMLLQPVIDLNDGHVVKAEALARLELEDGSVLGPDTFLPLLRHGEMDTLFQRGLDIALGNLVMLDRQGLHIDLSLNIAPRTLAEPDCRTWVEERLQRHGVEPHRLVLEVLENQRVDRSLRDAGVRRLGELGVRFAIDDLGSGYSSLRRLASLPFHAVKVDQDLLSRLYIDPVQSVSLISAVVQIGRDFGCQVIAEGLEDLGMIEVARLLGAGLGQGYAIAHPMPAVDLPAWSRAFRFENHGKTLHTPLGALAFQWISLRHGSLHTPALEDCPLTPLINCGGHGSSTTAALHAAVHAAPEDESAARRLLEHVQDCIRRSNGHRVPRKSGADWT